MRALLSLIATLPFATTLACTGLTPSSAQVVRAPAGSVALYRDRYGMAHLYAERESDGYFGLGYALAEDRLEGLLLFYRMLSGRLAEKFGPGPLVGKTGVTGAGVNSISDTVESDRSALQWRYLEDARVNLNRLSPRQRANMSAFIAGIVAYMHAHPDRVPEWAPELEPALALAGEGFLMIAAGGLPPACEPATEAVERPNKGSNITAVVASRTIDGAAAFTSDSHGDTEFFGTMFYPARLSAGDLDAWMLDIVGLPIGLKGHSRSYAWGWSEGPRFPADCLRLPLADGTGESFAVGNRVETFVEQPFSIAVQGAEPVQGTFRYARVNGVLAPVVAQEASSVLVVAHAYAGREGFAGEQFRAMLGAQQRAAMAHALSPMEIYPANIIIAGSDGEIRYLRPGRIPRRPAGTDPRKVIDAGRSPWQWDGIRQLNEVLAIDAPDKGYLTNENVSPDMMFPQRLFDPAAYPVDFAFEPGSTGTRQRRAIALLDATGQLSFTQLRLIVGDACIPGTDRWIARFKEAQGEPLREPVDAGFVALIAQFDGCFVPESRPALAHALWRIALRERDDAAGVEQAVFAEGAIQPETASALLEAARSANGAMARHAPAATFGDVFRIGKGAETFPSRGFTLPGIDPLAGQYGSLWGGYHVANSDGTYRNIGETRAPFLVQFTNPIRSYSLLPPGISDDPQSAHFNDQAPLVAQARLHSNFFEAAELAANVESVTILRVKPFKIAR